VYFCGSRQLGAGLGNIPVMDNLLKCLSTKIMAIFWLRYVFIFIIVCTVMCACVNSLTNVLACVDSQCIFF